MSHTYRFKKYKRQFSSRKDTVSKNRKHPHVDNQVAVEQMFGVSDGSVSFTEDKEQVSIVAQGERTDRKA